MAYIQPLFGQQLVIQVGDGATPEVFTAPSLINTSRGIQFDAEVEEDNLVDLANLDAPAQKVRRVKSTDMKIDGAGMLHKPDLGKYVQWAQSGAVKNVKITDGVIVITGPFILASFQVTGERQKTAETSLSLHQAGAVTVTGVA